MLVLVIDDDPAIGRLVRLILMDAGIEVESADNGRSALAHLTNGHRQPDLILLDLTMPDIDGREVFREARRASVTCPIVVCSAYGARAASRELGAQGALEKPFDPDALLETIYAVTGTGP
jgi:DNA-binding response OmpR family regulator